MAPGGAATKPRLPRCGDGSCTLGKEKPATGLSSPVPRRSRLGWPWGRPHARHGQHRSRREEPRGEGWPPAAGRLVTRRGGADRGCAGGFRLPGRGPGTPSPTGPTADARALDRVPGERP